MPRKPRSALVDGFTHVTARGNRRSDIFPTPLDYYEYLLLLDDVVPDNSDLTCHAFCLLPNHLHLLFEASQPALSDAMRYVNGVYAMRHNRRYALSGHVFQGRFHSEPIVRDSHLREVVRYLVLNPVRAGLCGRPEDWIWSSYAAYFDETIRPSFLTVDTVLGLFADDRDDARRLLAAFVDDGTSLAEAVRARELLR